MRWPFKVLVVSGACVLGAIMAGSGREVRADKALWNTCDFRKCTGTHAGFYDGGGQYTPVQCPLLQQTVEFLNCQTNVLYDCGYNPQAAPFQCWGAANIGGDGAPVIVDCWVPFQVCDTVYVHR